jgi:PspA associated protein B
VGLRDVLFGRKQLKEASPDRLFALATAGVTLEVQLGLRPGGSAAVCFKPLSAGEFAAVQRDLDELLDVAARDSASEVSRTGDEYGYQWIVVRDPQLEDLVTTVHLVSSELIAKGFGPQLLGSIFRFEDGNQPVFWIYAYKRGVFYPFVPTGKAERDNARELELKAKLEGELPIEEDLTRWYPLYDAPL